MAGPGGGGAFVAQLQALAGQAADKGADMCKQLPQLFGSADKVPPQVLEQCKRMDGAKALVTASGPTDICQSLEKVFGSLDKVPKEIQEKCKQADMLKAASGLAGMMKAGK
mmetsp:Transcript_160091/g.282282  ORF Transcript_160091/g.282282 Transcript_160091/m.282282 type:complete len:111 (-) Transcript_160091:87-419(-)